MCHHGPTHEDYFLIRIRAGARETQKHFNFIQKFACPSPRNTYTHAGLSVSRVGSSAQNKAMKKVGGALKMLMGEYRKMAGDQSLGGGAVSTVMIRGARCLQLFNQKGFCLLCVVWEYNTKKQTVSLRSKF